MAVMQKVQMPAKRFDIHGYEVESVTLEFQKINNEVNLFIVGERVTKHYVMSADDWPIWQQLAGGEENTP